MKPSISPEEPLRLYAFGAFRLEPATRQLRRSGEPVHLTPKVFDTLVFLVGHRHRVLSKDELLAALWPGLVVEENNLGQAISKLRQALGESPGDNRFIATVPGYGYRFVADVTEGPVDGRPATPAIGEAPRQAGGAGRVLHGLPMRLGAAVVLLLATVLAAMHLRAPGPPEAAPGPPRTLAVLPFRPLVTETGDPALELGIANSLILRLGAVDGLAVQPVSAVRRYQDPAMDPVAVGRALRVEAVLEGHLQRVDDRIRVGVRLLRVADGRQLWADEFDEALAGIFAIQDAISSRVVAALALQLDARARRRLARQSTHSAAAYEHYLRGRFHLSLAQPRQAMEMFEEAIALDPGYASAHAGLADILSRMPIATDSAAPGPMERARALAAQALALDPELASAHAVLGWIGFYYDWDWPASEASYRRALALDGADFSAHLGYAHLLSNIGRTAEALEQVDLALRADPLSPLAGTLRAQFLFHAGRTQEASAQLDDTLAAAPAFWIAHLLRGQLHLQAGRLADAVDAFDLAAASGGTWMPQGMAAHARARSGDARSARRILDAPRDAEAAPVPPYVEAVLRLGLGEHDAALAALQRALAERDVRMVFLGVDPIWQPLRDEPGFVELLARMGLAAAD